MILELYYSESKLYIQIKKPLVDNASVEIKRAFWKDFRWFSSNNMDWAVAECQQYGTVNSYLDLL